MSDPTLPSLEDPPETHPVEYIHEECGTVTRMPPRVKRTYLVDPAFYGDDTVCATCGEVPDSELVFEDTGETVEDYLARLLDEKPLAYHLLRWTGPLLFAVLFGVASQAGLLDFLREPGAPKPDNADDWAAVLGLCVGFFLAPYLRWVACRVGLL